MANSEVESITNGLDRCTNLLKDLLNEPYRHVEPKVPQPKARKEIKVGEKTHTKPLKVGVKKCWNYGAKKPPAKGGKQVSKQAGKNTKRVQGKTTSFDENLPSSTPIVTPIKMEKLQRKADAISITSSQCSLIELLQEYNSSQIPVKEGKNTPADSTLKASGGVEPIAKTPQPIHIPTSNSMEEKPVNIPEKSGGSLGNSWKETFSPQVDQSRFQLLQNENIMLHKQLQLLKEGFLKKEREKKNEDISLEVATLQCQNAALEQKLNEMRATSERTSKVQREVQELNMKLQEENETLHKELNRKEDELAMSGKLFTTETEQIKLDVGDALEKVELLRQSLSETDEANKSLSQACKAKDMEIQRLTELNKGLQSTVSRLLEDLKRPSLVPMVPNSDGNLSTIMLKRLDDILSVPITKPSPRRYVPPSPSDLAFSLPRTPIPFDAQTSDRQFFSPVSSVNTSIAVSPNVTTTPTASSSMVSVNTYAENEFNAGLAALDADIKRLQDSLRIET
uniref:Uncharacterized protein LOC100177078 n=1 Tax=Phallusia mammillata TaxID=59560 RepID=A0A6F9DH97_9ASCI|nr:uncharacterized protein LOC100177078 [Phallusia mammillata]